MQAVEQNCIFGCKYAAAAFCTHARRCFVCDAPHSCETSCRMSRGDGETAQVLVRALAPWWLLLDFDSTSHPTTRSIVSTLPRYISHLKTSRRCQRAAVQRDLTVCLDRDTRHDPIGRIAFTWAGPDIGSPPPPLVLHPSSARRGGNVFVHHHYSDTEHGPRLGLSRTCRSDAPHSRSRPTRPLSELHWWRRYFICFELPFSIGQIDQKGFEVVQRQQMS